MSVFDSAVFDSAVFDTGSGGGSSTLTVRPSPAAVAVQGYAPTITRTSTLELSPAPGGLSITSYAPELRQVITTQFSPAAASLAITGHAPSIEQASAAALQPQPGALAVQGYAPTITQTVTLLLSPAPGAIEAVGHAPTITRTGTPTDPRYARPERVVSSGSWAPSTGSDLAAMLDEPSADSSDYIEATSPGTCEIALAPVADPGASNGQVVRYMAGSSTGNGLIVRLKQGATVIAAWEHAILPVNQTIFAQSLSAAQCDAITDYSDLRFEFEAI